MILRTDYTATHHDWADSMASWAEHSALEADRLASMRADYSKADRNEGAWVEMQGRPAWKARANSPEMQPHIIDRMRESYDREDQSNSADSVLYGFFGVVFGVIALARVGRVWGWW